MTTTRNLSPATCNLPPVPCNLCFVCNQKPAQRDGRCPPCRLRPYTQPRFPFRPEWDEMLRQGYRAARKKPDIVAVITRVQQASGYPRHIIGFRVRALGLGFLRQRLWTAEETARLEEMLGTAGLRTIARRLHRSELSVRNRIHALGRANAIFTSYSMEQLRRLFGVPHAQVAGWVRRGWLRVDQDRRIPEPAVRRFVRERLDEISFRRADEPWLKSMLKSGTGTGHRAQVAGDREEACA